MRTDIIELSRASILKQNHGLDVYAACLREKYEGTNIKLSCRTAIARNPFDDGKETLRIELKKTNPEATLSPEVAFHHDLSGHIADGDCFDFVRLMFNIPDEQVLDKIDSLLHHREEENNLQPLKEPIPLPKFSFFRKPISNVTPTREITLLDCHKYIVSDYSKERTMHIRTLSDKRDYKAKYFDSVTFSGCFSRREDSLITSSSGLIVFDFDDVDVSDIRQKLLNDANLETQLLFVSPSGCGIKWIIKTSDIETGLESNLKLHHDMSFDTVTRYLKATYGFEPDQSGKNLSRACFLCYDPDCYINPKILNYDTSIRLDTAK